MADSPSDARIRDLKRRLELDPASRLFVSLAEEYRKAGRAADALITLQQGLRNHPGYVSAQVALGRAYIETGNISEAIATFTKVLTVDPGNLVSAKSLADIFLSRGESVEAIKKYKLYRALSGDRTVDEIVERLEREIAPPAPRPSRIVTPTPLPAPPTFFEAPSQAASRASRAGELAESRPGPIRAKDEGFEVTSIKWEESTAGGRKKVERPRDMPTQPFAIDRVLARQEPGPAPPAIPPVEPALPPIPPVEVAPPAILPVEPVAPFTVEPEAPEPPAARAPLDEVFAQEADFPFGGDSRRSAGDKASERATERLGAGLAPAPPEQPAEPQGRTLADLYFAQGHYTEALRIYDELVAATPFDAELRRLRRDAEARLLPAGSTPGAAAPDAGLQRRLGKIRALKEWLSVVQAG